METRPHAIIVGAGIAGLSAAYWVDKAGWRSTIIEQNPSIAPGGNIIHLCGPGYEALQRIGLDNIGRLYYGNSLLQNRRRDAMRLPFCDTHRDVEIMATGRGDLALALAGALPESARIRFGERVEHSRDDGDKVVVNLDGGATLVGALLIGADGGHSAIRAAYWETESHVEPIGYSYAAYEVETEYRHENGIRSMVYSDEGHLDVLYRSMWREGVTALHIWRDDHSGTASSTTSKYDVLKQVASKADATVSEVLQAAKSASTVPDVCQLQMVKLSLWSKGRIVLLGDAAHDLTLLSSQGAGLAMVSAEALAEELARATCLEAALGSWEGRVRPAVERLQQRIRKLGPGFLSKDRPTQTPQTILSRVLAQDEMVGMRLASEIHAELDLARLDRNGAVGPVNQKWWEKLRYGKKGPLGG